MSRIRRATSADLAAIAEIYNFSIRDSVATMDTVEKTAADRALWLDAHGDRYPALVCEVEGVVIGWADVHPWSDRIAYQTTVEGSVFIHPAHLARGYGKELLEELLAATKAAGFHVVVARIAVENKISLKLCKHLGFQMVGVMHEAGYKFDRWIDIAVLERVL